MRVGVGRMGTLMRTSDQLSCSRGWVNGIGYEQEHVLLSNCLYAGQHRS